MFSHGETVTRLRAGVTTDPYSDESVLDWDNASEVQWFGVAVWPAGSVEPLSPDRQSIEADFQVALPSGADVTRLDRLRLDDRGGLVCEITEIPFDYRNPFSGWAPGTVVPVKHIGG